MVRRRSGFDSPLQLSGPGGRVEIVWVCPTKGAVPSPQLKSGLFVQLPDLSGVSIDLGEQRFATF